MEWSAAEGHWLSRWLLTRLIALWYLVAFVAAARQLRPLVGERGLLPIPALLERRSLRQAPSLFHWRYSDRLADLVCGLGILLSAATALGVPQQGPGWLPLLVWVVLWVLYLSIVNVGQIFWAYGWESILLEAGILAALLGSGASAPPVITLVLFRWLLFRVEFGAGLIKIRGDECWRDLTCLEYHHETQPLPGPLSWHAHHLPRWWHRVEVAGNHLTQLVVPVGLFLPQPVAGISAVVIVATQAWLVTTGNFAWLNVLTMTLAVVAVPDAWLGWLPVSAPTSLPAPPTWLAVATVAAGAAVAVMSWWPVRNMASSGQRMNASFNTLHLVNTYGAFGAITRTRFELSVEGTTDDPSDPDARWRPYRFRGKPGEPGRRPPQVAPYHLRLDWQMWFAAMQRRPRRAWFRRFVDSLLDADPAVLGLLREDPFDGAAPAAVRVRRFRYRYTTPEERRATGDWWVREEVGVFLPPVTRQRSGRR